MPRQPREKSESGIYHIMLRGINQQVIFEDYEDYSKFIETLETYKAVSGYKVFAYCLMSNHIHILLKVEKEDLDLIMKREHLGTYIFWYHFIDVIWGRLQTGTCLNLHVLRVGKEVKMCNYRHVPNAT